MEKLRCREGKKLGQGYTSSKVAELGFEFSQSIPETHMVYYSAILDHTSAHHVSPKLNYEQRLHFKEDAGEKGLLV